MSHINLADVEWIDIENEWQRAVVELGEGDTTDNPSSTKSSIGGPALVIHERGPSGSIHTTVEEARAHPKGN